MDAVKLLLIIVSIGSTVLAFFHEDYRKDYKELTLAIVAGSFAYLTPNKDNKK